MVDLHIEYASVNLSVTSGKDRYYEPKYIVQGVIQPLLHMKGGSFANQSRYHLIYMTMADKQKQSTTSWPIYYCSTLSSYITTLWLQANFNIETVTLVFYFLQQNSLPPQLWCLSWFNHMLTSLQQTLALRSDSYTTLSQIKTHFLKPREKSGEPHVPLIANESWNKQFAHATTERKAAEKSFG